MCWNHLITHPKTWLTPLCDLCSHLYDFLTWTSQAQPQCVQIQKAWLGGVVPAVTDDESSVQDKALECLDRLLLQSVQHHREGCAVDDGQALAWALLSLLDTDSRKLGYACPGRLRDGPWLSVPGLILENQLSKLLDIQRLNPGLFLLT